MQQKRRRYIPKVYVLEHWTPPTPWCKTWEGPEIWHGNLFVDRDMAQAALEVIKARYVKAKYPVTPGKFPFRVAVYTRAKR